MQNAYGSKLGEQDEGRLIPNHTHSMLLTYHFTVTRTSRFRDPPEKVLIPWEGGRYVIIMSGDLEANKTNKLLII